jgi:hypothetical protein
MLTPWRNRFAYPVGAKPGVNFDNSAVVNGQLRFSGIGSQGTSTAAAGVACGFAQIYPIFKRGLTSASNAVVISSTIDGLLGPVNSTTISSNSAIEFANNTTANDLSYVIAAIFRTGATVAALQFICANSNSATATARFGIELTAAGVISIGSFFGTLVASGVTATVNTPYFVAASATTGQWRILVLNLQTGQTVLTNATTAITLTAPSGTVSVLGLTGNANSFGGRLAAFMFSNGFAGFPELLAWARDPWSFWYPTKDIVQFAGGGDVLFAQSWM